MSLDLELLMKALWCLTIDAKPGTPAKNYFNVARDIVFEIGLTPNRIDSGSHFGVARDLAAYLNLNEEFYRKCCSAVIIRI